MTDQPATAIELLPSEASTFIASYIGSAVVVEPLAGDASVRGYFRVVTVEGNRYMLAYYPEAVREQVERFVQAYEAIIPHARVPAIVHRDQSVILQNDVGDRTLFDLLHEDSRLATDYYRAAIDLLIAFQSAPEAAKVVNPPFDATRFFNELDMTREFYLDQLIGARYDRSEVDGMFHQLAETITSHPYVLCHRDYHGQNLHLFEDALYMIDYQDLRLGPDTYDIASLLRDRGAARLLGADTEAALLAHYREARGGEESIEQRYRETLLQRSIKTVGTFAKQAITRGRNHYLDYIPAAIESVHFCLDRLPGLEPLRELFPLTPSS